MKGIYLVLFGTLLCGTAALRDSSEDSDADKSDASVDGFTEKHETTVYCNTYCNCMSLNGSPTTYCCPDGKPDPSQCPGSTLSYGGNPNLYDIRPNTDHEVVQYMPPVISPGNSISYSGNPDWYRTINRAGYAVINNNCYSRLSAVLGGCRNVAIPPTYTVPCISRNCKPALPIYTGCTTRNCNTASRCCRPQVTTNHLRDAILTVVSQSYAMTKGEFIRNIETVIARHRELDWDPVLVRGSTGTGDTWRNYWPVLKHAVVPASVDTTDDEDDDKTVEDSSETEYQSV